MKKHVIFRTCVIFVAAIILATGWTFLKLEFAGSAYYTEKDWLEYEFYTPDLLKRIPRISDEYTFEFGNVTGPEAHVFSVHFQGVTDSNEIRNYLKSEGYEPQKTCNVEAECWRSYKNNDVISVAKFLSPKEVFVDVYRSPYTEPLADSK
ncbi:hypothetical protein [Erwinia pyrifoliae]|uniref:SPOR domain-containing protein n=1 Tax=Erwinia pyrifoliae TaxID=79967 RepID=A0ABY5X4E9_ERWPY|nr:hypothetical protein [Erwinia pyrifoliae]AUX72205.1 hypothetical protein CPI84_06775 [Erwinia pyrifoliae]MCA8877555.1 hypothetical protein [Erwinia pyrifoliae]MCT2388456.1 hypothetical protein [Erwinia pyrifoliae]MCU8586625.1 hypothetical protein [Erwinia pyrifoliae]UWS30515.1 hypothetical protein NYP81_03275 [Erwinia pyrifoliae]